MPKNYRISATPGAVDNNKGDGRNGEAEYCRLGHKERAEHGAVDRIVDGGGGLVMRFGPVMLDKIAEIREMEAVTAVELPYPEVDS